MASKKPDDTVGIVTFNGVDFPMIVELTPREAFEAERITGQSIDELGHATLGMVLAFFTVKRADAAIAADLTWDAFLDGGNFTVRNEPVPFDGEEPATNGSNDTQIREADGTRD